MSLNPLSCKAYDQSTTAIISKGFLIWYSINEKSDHRPLTYAYLFMNLYCQLHKIADFNCFWPTTWSNRFQFYLCIQKSIASLPVQRWEKTCAIYLNYSTNFFIYKSQWTDKIIEYMKKTNYTEEKQWEHTDYTYDRDR